MCKHVSFVGCVLYECVTGTSFRLQCTAFSAHVLSSALDLQAELLLTQSELPLLPHPTLATRRSNTAAVSCLGTAPVDSILKSPMAGKQSIILSPQM